MKTCVLACIAVFLWPFFTLAQINLVRNPSFEDKNTCNLDSLWGIDTTWFDFKNSYQKALFWISPNKESPDYYNKCQTIHDNYSVPRNGNGFQAPKDGLAYFGIATYASAKFKPEATGESREYLQTKLIERLEKDVIYCGKYFASPSFFDTIGNLIFIQNLGILLSNKAPRNTNSPVLSDEKSHTTIFAKPQIEYKNAIFTDTSSWFSINGLYKANGTEEWLTIGNFRTLLNTDTIMFKKTSNPTSNWLYYSYYYIDDVSLTKISDPIFSSHDTTVCAFPAQITARTGFDKYLWNTGDTTETITINQPGKYWVQVKLSECGTVNDTISVKIQPPIVLDIPNFDVCPSELPVEIKASLGFDKYWWSSGDSTQTVKINQAGNFNISVDYACGNLTDNFKITLKSEVPVFDLGETKNICDNFQIIPMNLSSSANLPNYLWSTGEKTPEINVNRPGLYFLTSKTDCNSRSDSVNVVGCPTQIYIPNAFSPNGDGENDIFTVFGISFENAKLAIFDRWGELVFDAFVDEIHGWDGNFRGKPAVSGVYVYRLTYKKPFSTEIFEEKGDLTLIR
jgi:gliding motility-associated-like protein